MKATGVSFLALVAGVLVFAAAGSAAQPIVTPGSGSTWVQPPAWIPIQGELPTPAPSAVTYPWVRPPARIPVAPKPVTPVTLPPGSSYPWAQPPAWIPIAGTPAKKVPVELPPSASYPWAQPPAWIPIQAPEPSVVQPPVSTGPVEPSWIG